MLLGETIEHRRTEDLFLSPKNSKTAEYIDYVLTRITLPGAIFLSIISIGPYYIKDSLGTTFYLGGTSVLICVGVALETLRQFESHLKTRHYEGFLEKGRIRGRRGY